MESTGSYDTARKFLKGEQFLLEECTWRVREARGKVDIMLGEEPIAWISLELWEQCTQGSKRIYEDGVDITERLLSLRMYQVK